MDPYISEADATLYFAERLGTEAWDDSTSADRLKGLLMSTRAIDQLNFLGEKTDAAQERQFPRADDSAIPTEIQQACAELALKLLDGVDPEMEYENLSMIAQGYSNVRSTYNRTNPPEYIVAGIPSITAWRLLKPFLRDIRTIDLYRVS